MGSEHCFSSFTCSLFHAPPSQHLSLPHLEGGGEFLHSSSLRPRDEKRSWKGKNVSMLWPSGRSPKSQSRNIGALIKRILLFLTGSESPPAPPAQVYCHLHVSMSAYHLWGPSTMSPTAQVLQATAHCHSGHPQSLFPIIRSLAGSCPTLFLAPST